MNNYLKIGAVMAGMLAPLVGAGCSKDKPTQSVVQPVRKRVVMLENAQKENEEVTIGSSPSPSTKSHVPPQKRNYLRGFFDDICSGIDLFDANKDQTLSVKEIDKWVKVLIDADQNGELSRDEIGTFYDVVKRTEEKLKKYDDPTRHSTHNLFKVYGEYLKVYNEQRRERVKTKIEEYEAAHPVKAETVDESDFESVK